LREDVVTEKSRRIESIFVCDPTHLPRSHAGNPPHDAPFTQFGILSLKQAKQRLVDVAEAEQAEIVSANNFSPGRTRGQDAPEKTRRTPALQS